MIQAKVFVIEAQSHEGAETELAEEFNSWMKTNPGKIYHIFPPERWNKRYGDYNYDRWYVSLTIFYDTNT